MARCTVCGGADTAACRYCDRPVCPAHERPSQHRCTGPSTAPSTRLPGADADRGRDPIRVGATFVLAVLLVSTVLLLGTSLGEVADTAPVAGPNETHIERLVHRFVNEERTARDRTPLAWNATLARIAADHSDRMAHRGEVGHGPGPLSERYARYGLACHGGENIYVGKTVGTPIDEPSVARRAVDAWLDSPGHRETLLAQRFDVQGVGVTAVHGQGRTTVYVTQDVC